MSNKNNPSQGRVRERLGPMWQQSQTMVGWNRQDKRQSKTRRNIKIEFPFQNGIENGFAAHAQQLIVLHFFTPSAIQALVNRTMMNHAVTKRTLRFNSLKTCNHSSLQVQCLSGCRCTCIFIHVSQLNRHVFHRRAPGAFNMSLKRLCLRVGLPWSTQVVCFQFVLASAGSFWSGQGLRHGKL